jgi:hypothetical protein
VRAGDGDRLLVIVEEGDGERRLVFLLKTSHSLTERGGSGFGVAPGGSSLIISVRRSIIFSSTGGAGGPSITYVVRAVTR